MDRNIVRAFWLLTMCFVAVLAAMTYRQAFAEGLSRHPANKISLMNELSVERGTIFTDDGSVLAQSKPSGDTFKREYPYGDMMAAVTGYYDPIRGRSGLELSQNNYLAGLSEAATPQDWFNSLIDKKKRGSDITITLKPYVQETAWQSLGDRKGAIVVLDPGTGAVLAMVSRPSFNPGNIAKDWSALATSPDSPLINRATQGRYPPGSTFKTITAAAALESGAAHPGTLFNGPSKLFVDGGKVSNYGGQSYGRLSMSSAFAKSINTVFAQVGLKVGAEELVARSRDFGFNSKPPFDIPLEASEIPTPASMDSTMLAWTSVGQGKTLATPLQMALVAAGVAANGEVAEPFLVAEARDYRGNLLYSHKKDNWRKAMKPAAAAKLASMMEQVVLSGTGSGAQIADTRVAGKTGTAETGDGNLSHAWFIGFAPVEEPKVAIAVIVENSGTGGQIAAPIARAVIETALGQ